VHEIANGIQVHSYEAPPTEGTALVQQRFTLGVEDDPDRPLLLITRFPPNVKLPRHYHGDVFMDAVVMGSSRFGEDGGWHHAGTVRWFPAKAMYGPVEAGPEGCTLLEFYVNAAGLKTTLDRKSLTPEMIAGLEARGIDWEAIAE
jgi:hypothetical protein